MLRAGLIEGADFDLDFHAIMHWGQDAALEKHYVLSRSQRTRSVLTFFAQDASTHNLVFANADVSKATQAREVLSFCEHWRSLTGSDPGLLVFDQKLTTQAVLSDQKRTPGSCRKRCSRRHRQESLRRTQWDQICSCRLPRWQLHQINSAVTRPAGSRR